MSIEAMQKKMMALYHDAAIDVEPSLPITLGSKGSAKDYTLEYDLAAARDILKGVNVNILAGIEQDVLLDPEKLIYILWCGLQRHHQTDFPKSEDVADAVSVRQVQYIILTVQAAIMAFMPDMDLLRRITEEETGKPKQGEDKDPLLLGATSSESGPTLVVT